MVTLSGLPLQTRFRRWRISICRASTIAASAIGIAAANACYAATLSASSSLSPPAPVAASVGDAHDAGLVAEVAANLATKPAVRARFRQTQTLAALTSPIVSTGSLLFLRERGVIWRLEAPYASLYVIGDAGAAQFDASGHRLAGSARAAAGVAQISRMMRAMLGGDLSALYAQFDVAAKGTPARWQIDLTPSQPQIAQAIRHLRMEGGAFVRTVVIEAANGDVTRLDFSGSTVVDAPPPADLALFGAL